MSSDTSSIAVLDPSAIQPVDFSEFKKMPPGERASYDTVEGLAIPAEKIQEFVESYANLFPNIEEVHISASKGLTDKSVNLILKRIPKLKKLHLQGNELESFVVNEPNQLTEINLSSNKLDRVNVIKCDSLEKLILVGNPLDPEHLFLPKHSYVKSGSNYKPNIKIIGDNFNENSQEVIGSFVASMGMSSYSDELEKKFGSPTKVTPDSNQDLADEEEENFYDEIDKSVGDDTEDVDDFKISKSFKPPVKKKENPQRTFSTTLPNNTNFEEEDDNIYNFDDEDK